MLINVEQNAHPMEVGEPVSVVEITRSGIPDGFSGALVSKGDAAVPVSLFDRDFRCRIGKNQPASSSAIRSTSGQNSGNLWRI